MHVEQDQLTLYHMKTCPYCMRVRCTLRQLGLKIRKKDVHKEDGSRQELMSGGGKGTVPCLRINEDDGTTTWMYESSDIIAYLKKYFA